MFFKIKFLGLQTKYNGYLQTQTFDRVTVYNKKTLQEKTPNDDHHIFTSSALKSKLVNKQNYYISSQNLKRYLDQTILITVISGKLKKT